MASAGAVSAHGWLRGVAAVALALAAVAGHAQAVDERRPMRLIVPAPPGGSADKVGHLVAAQLAPLLGRPIRVDDIATGGLVGGINAIAASAPDGETLGLAVSTAMIGGRFLIRGARYNPTEDFVWFAILGSYANAMVIPARDPARTLEQWVEAKRSSPRPLVAGSFGPGSAGHLATSYLRVEQRINLVPRFIDTLDDGYALLASGAIDVLFDGVPNAVVELPKSGHRAIAVTSSEPVAAFPDLPAFGRVWPGVSFEVWLGLVTPKGLPEVTRARLATAINALLLDRRHAESLRAAGLRYRGIGATDALAFVEDEVLRTARLISRFGETTSPAR